MITLQCMKIKSLNKIKCIRKCSTSKRVLKKFLHRNLLLMNTIISGTCMALGDIVQQEFEFRSSIMAVRYDWTRLGRMFIMGTLLGSLYHYYYTALDVLIPKISVKTSLIKIMCDQAIASPITLFSFYYGMGILERKSLEVCTAELEKKFLTTYSIDCLYWPPIQFINFYFLPTLYRVVYINGALIVYNVFLSYMKHYDQHKPY